MNLYLRVLKITQKYYLTIIIGVIAMILYSIFNGMSMMVIKPIIDNILNREITTEQTAAEYSTFKEMGHNVKIMVSELGKIELGNTKQIEKTARNAYKAVISHFDAIPAKIALKIVCIYIFLIFLLKNIFFYIRKFLFVKLENIIIREIRLSFFQRVLFYPMSFFKQYKSGDLISRATQDITVIKTIVINNLSKILQNFFTIAISVYFAMKINSKLFLMSLIIIPPMGYVVNFVGKKLKKYSKRLQEKIADIYSSLQESLTSISVVKAFSAEQYEIGKFSVENEKYYKNSIKLGIYQSLGVPISEMSSSVMIVTILWLGAMEVMKTDSTFTAGSFFSFLGIIFAMLHPLKEFTKTLNEIQKGRPVLERVFQIIDYKGDIVEAKNPKHLDDFENQIVFNDVSFKYFDSNEYVLKNINFTVKKGEKVALVGPSGSGKTTISSLLPRFYDTNSGEILIDGINIKELSIDTLRSIFGIVNQDVALFNDSIRNNIAYGKPNADFQKIINAAEVANIKEFVESLPEKYETIVGERGAKLSGGQKQRIAIARAIFKNPPILIFDEATSALDTESEALVQKAIDNLLENRTAIVIAHRLSTIINSDKIVVLDKGQIIDVGNHEVLYNRCEFYKKLYDLQFNI